MQSPTNRCEHSNYRSKAPRGGRGSLPKGSRTIRFGTPCGWKFEGKWCLSRSPGEEFRCDCPTCPPYLKAEEKAEV